MIKDMDAILIDYYHHADLGLGNATRYSLYSSTGPSRTKPALIGKEQCGATKLCEHITHCLDLSSCGFPGVCFQV
jgi:hypothetical protein